jgi:hypothetical protein
MDELGGFARAALLRQLSKKRNPMTDLETWLKEVQARCDASTEGPWDLKNSGHLPEGSLLEVGTVQWIANREFIAHAREDLSRALEEIRKLQAMCDAFQVGEERALRDARILRNVNGSGHSCTMLAAKLCDVERERDEARAQLQSVRAQRDAAEADYNSAHGDGWRDAEAHFAPALRIAMDALEHLAGGGTADWARKAREQMRAILGATQEGKADE